MTEEPLLPVPLCSCLFCIIDNNKGSGPGADSVHISAGFGRQGRGTSSQGLCLCVLRVTEIEGGGGVGGVMLALAPSECSNSAQHALKFALSCLLMFPRALPTILTAMRANGHLGVRSSRVMRESCTQSSCSIRGWRLAGDLGTRRVGQVQYFRICRRSPSTTSWYR